MVAYHEQLDFPPAYTSRPRGADDDELHHVFLSGEAFAAKAAGGDFLLQHAAEAGDFGYSYVGLVQAPPGSAG